MSLLDFVAGAHAKVLRVSGGCHNCPLKRVSFVPATLEAGSVLFLGEIPGETDVTGQKAFTGAGGQLLRAAAKEAGIPEPWSFSNAVHCRTPEGVTPKPKVVECCLSQFVLDEIRGYQYVVLCGSVPLQALFPGAKADHFRGNVAWHPDFPEQRFYAIYSPSYIVRRPDLKDEFHKHMARLGRLVRGEDTQEKWEVVHGKAAIAALKEMLKAPLISADLETNRLESYAEDGKIKSAAVTVDGKTVAYAEEDDPHFPLFLQLLAEYLEDESKSVLGAHIGFDLVWLEQECGIRVKCRIHETGVQWYHAGQYQSPSLKELVSAELDGYRYLVHQPHMLKDKHLLRMYNAEDVVHPLQLMKKALKVMKPKTRDLVTRVLGPTDLILTRMSAHGIYLRQDYRQQKIEEYQERRRGIIAAWKDFDPEFIPSDYEGGDGLRHYLFNIRQVPVLGKTDGGDPAVDKSALKQWVRDGHQVAQFVLDMREIDKILSTYLTAYDKHVWPDSRIRSSYPLTWTDSGRSSSRNPNLQNIPRKKEIRDLFGVPEGSVLIESDLSQIEFRIMVCLAKDENGIAGYMRGDDAHTMTARGIIESTSGVKVEKPTKEQRSNAKPVNFMFLYGGQAPTAQKIAADDYGVIWTDQQAQNFRDMFMRTYPRVPVFHEHSKAKLIKNRGWFESVVGHVFRYHEWDSRDQGKRDHALRAALNAEAQGPAAQICFYIMVLARRLLDERGFHTVAFVNTVHDSILIECPHEEWVQDVVATINEAAAQAHEWVKSWFVVPLIMEHAAGQSWGSLEEIK